MSIDNLRASRGKAVVIDISTTAWHKIRSDFVSYLLLAKFSEF